MIPPSLIHTVGQWSRYLPTRDFLAAADRPLDAQQRRLLDILARNRDTEYGRKYGFAGIQTADDYARRVPLVTPEALRPWVDRTMRGERGLLTAEAPIYYVRTTGSTGLPKHVPLTPTYRWEYQRSLNASLWHVYRRFPQAFTGRALYFVGSLSDGEAPDGNRIGSMSGFNFMAMPAVIRALYAWPGEVFAVRDLRTRSWLSLRYAMLGDITFIGAIFPAVLVQLLRDFEVEAASLVEHLRAGTLPADLVLTPEQRAFFSTGLRPEPRHADRLRDAIGAKHDFVRVAWPHLRLVYCWTGSTAALWVPELRRRLGPDVLLRDAVYAAAEGWCNVPMGEEEPGGPLAVNGHYYEFLADSGEVVPLADLRVGERYGIVLTTSGGAYRYVLGDIVEVYARFRQTPCIRFVRKAGATSSLVGEKLDESHANLAFQRATVGMEASWFCLAPEITEGSTGYALYIESSASDAALTAVGAAFDRSLADVAHDYAGHRADRTLSPLVVRRVATGSFARWQQEKADAGDPVAQIKTAHLVGDVGRLPSLMRDAKRVPSRG